MENFEKHPQVRNLEEVDNDKINLDPEKMTEEETLSHWQMVKDGFDEMSPEDQKGFLRFLGSDNELSD